MRLLCGWLLHALGAAGGVASLQRQLAGLLCMLRTRLQTNTERFTVGSDSHSTAQIHTQPLLLLMDCRTSQIHTHLLLLLVLLQVRRGAALDVRRSLAARRFALPPGMAGMSGPGWLRLCCLPRCACK